MPIIEQFQQRHGLIGTVVVADAGMLSAKNLNELDEANLGFIVGSRLTKAPGELAHHFHWHGDAFADGQLIETATPRHGNAKARGTARRTEPVWDPQHHHASWRAIWQYSRKRAVRDGKTLTLQENRARDIIDGHKQARSTRFVKTTDTGRSLDQASLERARRLAGFKGYVTNIPAEKMAAAEVVSSYHDLWVRREALVDRVEVRDLRRRSIAVGR